MRPKGHQQLRKACLRGALGEASQDVAVPEVHAVERSNRDDRAAGELWETG
jgi:hypothetical protein